MTVLEIEQLTNHRLVFTSYLEQRKISFKSGHSLRIDDSNNQYLEYWFNQNNSLIKTETGLWLDQESA
jgi:hypothetical protein